MASYRSYKKVTAAMVPDSSISIEKLEPGSGPSFCVKHVYGTPNSCTPGCCCYWQVPSGATRITWEVWGAGGNGNGACSCNRCHHYRAPTGGAYNIRTIQPTGGCQYTVCAGGVYRCCSRECNGCEGCSSYVHGYNLSNFCARGGARGCANTDWSNHCHSTWWCCIAPGSWGGDFTMTSHQAQWSGHWDCHCGGSVGNVCSVGAPFLAMGKEHKMTHCWIRCGCWTAPYATGGNNGMTSYCGSGHCGQGGQGGSGVVRITWM